VLKRNSDFLLSVDHFVYASPILGYRDSARRVGHIGGWRHICFGYSHRKCSLIKTMGIRSSSLTRASVLSVAALLLPPQTVKFMDQLLPPPIETKVSDRCELSYAMHVTAIVGYLRAVVRDPNADITLQSSDSVLFRFYKKQLEAHSGAFAGAEAFTVYSTKEPVFFTEPSEIVDLLLQLMSQEPPDLESLEFQTLALLAEAVEKYDLFASRAVCRILMRCVYQYFMEK
jgi:hypothetical protein